jgi:hypothetical protein
MIISHNIGWKVNENLSILGVLNGDIPKEDIPMLIKIRDMPFKVFFRAIYQGVQYQSMRYCRSTKRNNYTVMFDECKAGFIDYFIELEMSPKDKEYYAVIRLLIPADIPVISSKLRNVNVELDHMRKYKKTRYLNFIVHVHV